MNTTKADKLELSDAERAEVVARLKEGQAEEQVDDYDTGWDAGVPHGSRWADR